MNSRLLLFVRASCGDGRPWLSLPVDAANWRAPSDATRPPTHLD
jgi:hypothetical protein